VDPARGGAAETAMGEFRRGYCTWLDGFKTARTTDIVRIVKDRAHDITVTRGLRLQEIRVDEPGQGVGVIDELIEAGLPVYAYNGSMPMVQDRDPPEDIRLFENARARDWWRVRRKLELGVLPLPADEVLLAQGTSVKYTHNKKEKIVIESKQDLKDRLGKDASPDRFDVIVIGTADRYDVPGVHGEIKPSDIYYGAPRPQMEMDL
jgi:hypothetical protein